MTPAPELRLELYDADAGKNRQNARSAKPDSQSPTGSDNPIIANDRLERVWGWGMSSSAMSYVFRPSTLDDLREVFAFAQEKGLKIGLRGTGCSYGDASQLREQISLDLTRMRRILSWDPDTGIADIEPGVTVEQLWKYTVEDGWWPYVVSGTMYPTIGGAAGMNIHGKNNFAVGPIGDHILEFDLMLPSDEIVTCNREENSDLFYAAIGGFGMLGCFTRIQIELKKVYSGLLRVTALVNRNLMEAFQIFEERLPGSDYLVGWIDCFAKGDALGRGEIHQADYLKPGEDPNPNQTLRVAKQELPDTFLFGLLPKAILWRVMKMLWHDPGLKFTNWAKYVVGKRHHGAKYLQSHAGFAFLLDYVPNWKKAYGKGGLIQYQSFVPKEKAQEVFRKQIELQHQHGLVSYLGVMKRHRPDDFWMTHAVDGYSLALDFRVTEKNRDRLWKLAAEMNKLVVDAGGRFYYAKDLTLSPDILKSYMQEDRVKKFVALKAKVDPDEMMQTELWRRLFKPAGS